MSSVLWEVSGYQVSPWKIFTINLKMVLGFWVLKDILPKYERQHEKKHEGIWKYNTPVIQDDIRELVHAAYLDARMKIVHKVP